MSTATTVDAQAITAPKFNLEAMEREVEALVAQGAKDLEFELRKERIDPYRIDITKPFIEPEPMIAIDGSCLCSAGNISAIVGEAKSKKTFLTTAIVASAIAYRFKNSPAFKNISNNITLNVLWLDTEQSEGHVRKVIDRINTITGIKRTSVDEDTRLNVYALRELDPAQRREVLVDSLYTLRPNLVVIDGIADLQRDTNDLRESEALVGELMALSTVYNCHIICILHTNPGTDKARGHVGSALQRKAESVIYVHKVEDISVVEPQFCRNEPFERFAFRVNDQGIPYLCELPVQNTDTNSAVAEILSTHFGGSVERKVLTNKLVELHGVSSDTARMRIGRAIKSGVIVQEGNIVRTTNSGAMPTPEPVSEPVSEPAPAPTPTPKPTFVQTTMPYHDCPRNFTDMEDEVPF
ncbi:MAG: AAA family ATPase [Alistipes sp.]|nr:AAA family ATPase [Alistipes sp.]